MKFFRTRFLSFLTLMLVISLSAPGCAGKKNKKKQDQLAALRGEDIPLTTSIEDWQFVEASDPMVFGDIYFDYNSSVISEEARPQLQRISEWLSNKNNVALMIEGHCDERGSKEYNLALGEQRALAVRRYLASLGVEADRVYTVSYGEEKPKISGRDEQTWSQNRRAHFLVTR